MMSADPFIVGIGACNVDLSGRSFAEIHMHDSNPGRIHLSPGGVTRNILENFCLLGGRASLISVVGDDPLMEAVLQKSSASGIDVSQVIRKSGANSSSYLSILDEKGEMVVALSDMSIQKQMTIEDIAARDALLRDAALIICDPTIPPAVMEYLLTHYGEETPVFCDPVSLAYSQTIKASVHRFHTLKPNLLELEVLSDTRVVDGDSLRRASRVLIDKGTKRLFVSMGKHGYFYADEEGRQRQFELAPLSSYENATGAGDASMAMIAYAYLHDYAVEETLAAACAAGIAAIRCKDTINPDLSISMIQEIIKERSNAS